MTKNKIVTGVYKKRSTLVQNIHYMHYQEGQDIPQIAVAVGVSQNEVRSILQAPKNKSA